MRATQHNARKGKNGVFNPKHNDRNFDIRNAPHIGVSLYDFKENFYHNLDLTFEEVEKTFYEEHFSPALEKQNLKYAAKGQYCYVRTSEDYRMNEKTCPEEQLLYIGNKSDNVSPKLLLKVFLEQMMWEEKRFPNVKVLDYALHTDESGACHIQKRQVWIAHDKNGDEIVSQNKALKEMGVSGKDIEITDENGEIKVLKWGSRYNNAKILYTAECREHYEELCRKNGIELETERLEKSQTGLTLLEYKMMQLRKEQEELEHQNRDLKAENDRYSDKFAKFNELYDKFETKIKEAEERGKREQKEIDRPLIEKAEKLTELETRYGKNIEQQLKEYSVLKQRKNSRER